MKTITRMKDREESAGTQDCFHSCFMSFRSTRVTFAWSLGPAPAHASAFSATRSSGLPRGA